MAAELRILGSVSIAIAGDEVPLGPQLRRLVGLLAINAGHIVPSDRIAEALWPDELSDPGTKAVRTYVARLRRSLGDHGTRLIRTQAPGYRLELGEDDCLDALELEAALDRLQPEDAVARLSALDEGLAWWAGPPLAEFADEPWAHLEAVRLEEVRLRALEDRYDAALDAGLHASSVAGLEQLVAANPLRDRLTAQLMLALQRAGRQADALRTYQQHREVMVDAGLEASAELRLLDERIARDDPLLRLETEPDRIRGYLRGERLGEGAFSTVWRAVQPTLDRDVAIKQVKAELADRPEFVRAFEREAHLVASLENPRIVPLYDYWREVGAAYLVMRYLRGGTLAEAIPRRGASLELVSTVAGHVGEALQAAHARGVVHRDVKPANIFLDEVGNAYLGDFGIAIGNVDRGQVDGGPLGGSDDLVDFGSVAYASPEQRRREPGSAASDLFCFAVALFEALTGEVARDVEGYASAPVPPVTDLRPDLPGALDDVLARATAVDPAERYGSVAEFVRAFAEAVDTGRAGAADEADRVPGPIAPNPYRGLAAFDEADAPQFFGRRRLVEALIGRLSHEASGRLVAVVGPSGSGKSSVVRAGLLPVVRRGMIRGSDRWFIATMKPGLAPFEELEVALSHLATETHPGLGEILRGDARGIARAVKLTLPDDRSDLLLIVDQFEELYTTCADPAERDLFSAALASAVVDPNSRLRVVLTIRADFWDRPLRDPALAELVESHAVHVVPLSPDEMEEAIVEPARGAGCTFDPGLVARVAADVAGQPGPLPLVQYALTELFEHRDGALLTTAAYDTMGGVSGAIGQRADTTFATLHDDEQVAARRVFGRLVTLGEGTEDTRRRVARLDLGADDVTGAVLDAFGAARLLSFDRDDTSREPTVEIAHEALLREWPRLRSWLDDDRADLRVHRHLERAARDWAAGERPDAELYRGGRLESASEWSRLHPTAASDVEREFLDRSETRATAERQRDRTRLRRLRGLLAGVGIALLVAIAASLFANAQRVDANNARDEARLGELTAEAASLAQSGEDPDLAMLLAVEANRRSPDPETLGALQRSLVRDDGFLGYLVGQGGHAPNSLRFSGDRLVVRAEARLEVWDVAAHELVADVDVGLGTDLAVAEGVAYTPSDGRLARLDLETGDIIFTASSADVSAVDVTADGRLLLVGHQNGTIEAWSRPALDLRTEVGLTGREITHLALSPDGTNAVSVDDAGCCRFWDVETGAQYGPPAQSPALGVGQLMDVRWIDDESVVLAVGGLQVFDGVSPRDVGNRDAIFAIAVLDGDTVVHGDEVVSLSTGAVRRKMDARDGDPVSVAVGDGVIAIATRRAISLWSVDGTQLLARSVPRDGANTGYVDADGTQVIALRRPRDFTIYEVETGRVVDAPLGQTALEESMAAWMPTGELMTFTWGTNVTRVWDPDTLQPVSSRFLDNPWYSFTASPDGRFVAFGGATGSVTVRELETGRFVATLPELGEELSRRGFATGIPEVRFSWDGAHLVAVSEGVSVWDTDSWEQQAFLIAEQGEPGFRTVGLSRDGAAMAVGDAGGRVTFVDTTTWQPLGEPLTGGPDDTNPFAGTHGMRFTEDDRYLVMTGRSGAQLFAVSCRPGRNEDDCSGWGRVGGLWPSEELLHVNPSPTGRHFATATEEHLLVWEVDPERWPEVACSAAGRSLTEDEWERFIGGEPYAPAC